MTRPDRVPPLPSATYRVQFNRQFTFVDAAALVPYWRALGITHCYASPYFKSVPGSLHGYDLVDPTTLNPEVGAEEDYRTFIEALQRHGMGHILDVVPNHMGIGQSANPWWLDVLENGPSSRYAHVFDIDWHPLKRELEGKVLLPILGDLYGAVLENQEIALAYEEGHFVVRYYNHTLPVAPKSSARILTHRLDTLMQEVGEEAPHVQELESIITALGHLPARTCLEPKLVNERYREKEIIRQRLTALVRDSPTILEFVQGNVALFNGTKGDPKSFDLLDALLNDQAYRMAYWRVASEEINYRRFFDINELAAIRMEEKIVLDESHRLVFRLLKEGAVTGLRIDHVDGLYDPGRYLQQLQAWARKELPAHTRQEFDEDRPLYLIVEKILGKDEPLPETWPVYGTTGYEFLNLVNGLFVQSAHERAFDDIYEWFIQTRIVFDDLVYESKRLIMRVSMASELNVLGHHLNMLSERDRRSRDFTLNSLTHALREIIACFPVYRTYVTEGPDPVRERDRTYIRLAVARAKRRNPAVSGLVFDFVRSLLLKEWDERTQDDRQEQQYFVMKFQQTTSPVTAKGIEDTAYYSYNRFVSLNEVGGDPQHFGITPAMFHARMRERQANWPLAMSTTATHDTKRSEDVRTRINVLGDLPGEWRTHLNRWSRLNRKYKTDVEGQTAPDRNEEYLLYQTLIGAWPFTPLVDEGYRHFIERIQTYMSKALRESKVHTSWINPDQVYEDAVNRFIEGILNPTKPNPFLEDFRPFQGRIAEYGIWNSLSQVLLKITAPGIPDFYQGTELWDLSLVDPDNRRPVGYAARIALLDELKRTGGEDTEDRRELVRRLVESRHDGRIKLYVTMAGLNYRRSHAALFHRGEYVPLEVHGSREERLCAFTRIHQDEAAVVIVPRLLGGTIPDARTVPVGPEVWVDTVVTIPSWRSGSHYRNVLTGSVLTSKEEIGHQVLSVAEIFSDCPVALLERIG